MMTRLDEPAALATVRWVTALQGGRRTGPPTAPVYAATASFASGGVKETGPARLAEVDQFSILIERTGEYFEGAEFVKIGFLVLELVWPHLQVGAKFLVLEGPKTVAYGRICELFE